MLPLLQSVALLLCRIVIPKVLSLEGKSTHSEVLEKLNDPETCPNKRPLSKKQQAYQERRRHEKEQAKLETQKIFAELELEATLTRWLPLYVDALTKEFEKDNNPFRERWVKNRCDRIVRACKFAKKALRILYPLPEPGSLVLGTGIPIALLDSDGRCREAVLGGRNASNGKN